MLSSSLHGNRAEGTFGEPSLKKRIPKYNIFANFTKTCELMHKVLA